MCANLAQARGIRRYAGLSLCGVQEVAREIAGLLTPGSSIFVCGDVGAGKTAFCREMVENLSVDPFLGSPTFPVICEYKCLAYRLYHIDLYRISSIREVSDLGIYDLVEGNVTLIEWPEVLGDTLSCCFRVSILPDGQNTRTLEVECM